MISNLSSIGNSATQASGSERSRPSAEEMFKKLDTDGKGYLTESDMASISKEGSAKAEEMFKKMDTDGDGKVTESEFSGAAEKMEKSGGGQKAEHAHGGGHGGGGGASKTQSSSSTSSSEQTYDPADANEDGKVSEQEQQAYDAKQTQAQVAVKAYEDVAAAQ